jgi:hypothetical protein
MSNSAANLDEYDKSVFCTKAQEEIVKNYFNPKGNKYQEGFDDDPKRQADFAALIQSKAITISATGNFDKRTGTYKGSWDSDVFIMINEQMTSSQNSVQYTYTIRPISFTEYDRVMQKPLKYPPKNQVWRLITGTSDRKTQFDLIGMFNGTPTYEIRYVKRPKPIILVDLSSIGSGLTINGYSTVQDPVCEMSEHLHEEILQRAVELAKAAYATDQNGTVQLNNQVQVGQRSE